MTEKKKGEEKKTVDYYLYFALPANYSLILVEKLGSYILGTNGPWLLYIMATNKLTSSSHRDVDLDQRGEDIQQTMSRSGTHAGSRIGENRTV